MENNIKIEPASLDSLDELSALFQKYRIFYKKEPDTEGEKQFLKERITNKESVIYLAKSGDSYIGFVQLFPMFSSTRITRLWLLNDLYVEEDYRKSGAASMLIEKSKELTRETNYAGLMLQTAKTNTTAQSVYDKNDFVQDDNFYSYYWFNK
ncbi:MAG: GNAT family N-acetyltransferase [Bacteroidetes bacterium]|nr:GNAT family N-acetyltransferase [Bacteroidota bacterium]